jgi:hypothetical protein
LNIGFLTITSADQDEIQHRGDWGGGLMISVLIERIHPD